MNCTTTTISHHLKVKDMHLCCYIYDNLFCYFSFVVICPCPVCPGLLFSFYALTIICIRNQIFILRSILVNVALCLIISHIYQYLLCYHFFTLLFKVLLYKKRKELLFFRRVSFDTLFKLTLTLSKQSSVYN